VDAVKAKGKAAEDKAKAAAQGWAARVRNYFSNMSMPTEIMMTPQAKKPMSVPKKGTVRAMKARAAAVRRQQRNPCGEPSEIIDADDNSRITPYADPYDSAAHVGPVDNDPTPCRCGSLNRSPSARLGQPRSVSLLDNDLSEYQTISNPESNTLADPVNRICARDIPRVYASYGGKVMAPASGPNEITRDTSYAKVLYTNRINSALYSFPDPNESFPKGAGQAFNKQLAASEYNFDDGYFDVINTSHDDSVMKGRDGYYDSCCGKAEDDI
jgi:hypothetical protein